MGLSLFRLTILVYSRSAGALGNSGKQPTSNAISLLKKQFNLQFKTVITLMVK
jgi:hypothetical protein